MLARRADGKTARIDINYHGVRAHFTTDNVNVRRRVDRDHAEGRAVPRAARRSGASARWRRMRARSSSTLAYEFKTPVLEAVVGPVFNHIANTFIDAFVRRAEAVYAKRNDRVIAITVAYAAPGIEAIVPLDAARGSNGRPTPSPRAGSRATASRSPADARLRHPRPARATATRRSPTATGSRSRGRSLPTPRQIRRARAAGKPLPKARCAKDRSAGLEHRALRRRRNSANNAGCPLPGRRRYRCARCRFARSAAAGVAAPSPRARREPPSSPSQARRDRAQPPARCAGIAVAQDVAIYALGLIGVDYRFGGNTPEPASTAAASSATCSSK